MKLKHKFLWKDYASSFPIELTAEGDSSRAHHLRPMDLRLNSGNILYQAPEEKKSAELELLVRDRVGLLLCLSLELKQEFSIQAYFGRTTANNWWNSLILIHRHKNSDFLKCHVLMGMG